MCVIFKELSHTHCTNTINTGDVCDLQGAITHTLNTIKTGDMCDLQGAITHTLYGYYKYRRCV